MEEFLVILGCLNDKTIFTLILVASYKLTTRACGADTQLINLFSWSGINAKWVIPEKIHTPPTDGKSF